MKDAEFIEYEVDIHLQCPSCNKYFRLRNYDIPQNAPSYHNCLECSEGLVVQPFTIVVSQGEFKKPASKTSTKKKSSKQVPTKPEPASSEASVKKQAIQIMKNYGFKYVESKRAVEKVYYAGIGLEELVKKALAEFGNWMTSLLQKLQWRWAAKA